MFYEESKLNNELNCAKCNQRLDEPRILPCGDSICSYCHLSIEVNKNKFKCFFCHEEHEMPEKGLLINKGLFKVLALNPEEVFRGEKVKKLKEFMNEIKENINKLTYGINNGVDRIKELCLDLMNKVQLKTEEAIEQLNDHNKEMITEIEEFQKDCITSYLANEKANDELKTNKQELEAFNLKWNEYLRQSAFSDENISEAIAKANELAIKAKQDLAKLDEFIFNGGEMKFEKNENKLEKSVLGLLVRQKSNCESTILSSGQMAELMSICKFPSDQKWKLIYRATRDGFDAKDFHSKCDSYQNSLVIIKSSNCNVFGGFTEVSWSGSSIKKGYECIFI